MCLSEWLRLNKRNPLSKTFPLFHSLFKNTTFLFKFNNNNNEMEVVKCEYPIMVILREDLSGSWEIKTESSASLEEMTLGYRSFWRFGNTVVNSQIRRFNLPTESSPQTHTVYSFPLHFTINVSSSSVTDDDAIESVPFLAVPNSSIQDS